MKYITGVLNIPGSCKPVNHKPEMFKLFKDALDFNFFSVTFIKIPKLYIRSKRV